MATMKIKAKEKDGIVKVKALIKHPMLTYDQAKNKGLEANFITRIVAKVGEKVVYEMSSSQFLAKNPLIKFRFYGEKGETMVIHWQDLSGENITETKKIK